MSVSVLAGTRLGRYRVGSSIGRGGMGEIYEAEDLVLERRVALKILAPELLGRPDRIQRFIQEAKSASALNHPHILTVHEIGEEQIDGQPVRYMAMELIEGMTLREEIHTRRAPLNRLLEVLGQAADALASAHSKGIIHRDLKPDNIMVTADGYAKVIDFGLAKLAEPRLASSSDSDAATLSLTREGSLLGTVGYMSPEQVERKPTDERSDIFSFGCILYEAISRTRAFSSDSEVGALYKIVHQPPPPLENVNGTVPLQLKRIVERCLEKRPDDRYQSMRDLAMELRQIQLHLSGEREPAAGVVRWRPTGLAIGIAIGLLSIISLAAMLELVSNWRPTTEKVPVMRALATWPSDEYDCRFSPDGIWVSFLSTRRGQPGIWIRRLKGGEPAELVDRPREIKGHAWSPQSDEIAYLSDAPDATFLQFVPAFGGPPRQSVKLESRFRNGRIVRWIGGRLYLESADGLWRFEGATRKVSKVAEVSASEGRRVYFDVSRDESKIAYQVHAGDHDAIWMAPVDGSHPIRLTELGKHYSDFCPMFGGRNDEQLFFSSNRSGQIDLWRMDLATRAARQITFSASVEWIEDISADGLTVAFKETRNYSQLWVSRGSPEDSRNLSAEGARDLWPTRSREGRRLAFQRAKGVIERSPSLFDSDILLANLDGGVLTNERLAIAVAASPQLAPNGEWLTYIKPGSVRGYELWIKDLQSEHQWRASDRFKLSAFYMFPVDSVESNLAWAPDNSAVYFVERVEAKRQEIRVADPRAGTTATVVAGDPDTDFHDLQLSRDARTLAYVRRKNGVSDVVVRDLITGHERVLFSRTHDWHERIFCRGWMRTGNLLVLHSFVNADRSERIDAVRVTPAATPIVMPAVAQGFGGTARLDVPGDLLFLTAVDAEGFHNLEAISLADGHGRKLTNNQLPGISYATLEVLARDSVIFSRQESNEDLWLIDL